MKKIILLENDPELVNTLTSRLKTAGHDVYVALDPIRGLGIIIREQPDLLVLDLNVPGSGGLVLIERLKKLPAFAEMPIIVIAPREISDTQVRVNAMGINEIFECPLELSALMSSVAGHLTA